MTVQELIEELQKVEDKGLDVVFPFGEYMDIVDVSTVQVGEWEKEGCSHTGKQRMVRIDICAY